MTRINDLSTVSGSTNTNSQFIWAVWNGKDYKVPLVDVGKYIGRSPGTMVSKDGGTSANFGDGTYLTWDHEAWDTLGWFDAASNDLMQVKDDKVTRVDVKIQVSHFGTALRYISLNVNGTDVASATMITGRQMTGSYPCQWAMLVGRYPVSSGDLLRVRTQGASTNTLQADRITHFQVTPAEYK